MAKKTIYLMPVRISKARIQRLYRRAEELAPIYAGEARRSCNRLCFHENDKMSAELEGQAREFLSHPENVELLKDYFMI